MNKHIQGLPFYLLSVFSILALIKDPSISQAIIILGLAGLSGYRYYQEQIKQPNYKEEFKIELDSIKKNYLELKNEVGKVSLEKTAIGSKNKSGFSF